MRLSVVCAPTATLKVFPFASLTVSSLRAASTDSIVPVSLVTEPETTCSAVTRAPLRLPSTRTWSPMRMSENAPGTASAWLSESGA